MNYFDMIFKNSNSREFVFSSVFNYLVDKTESHGLGSLVFERILESLPKNTLTTVFGRTETANQYCDGLYIVKAEYDLGAHYGFVDSMIEFDKTDGKVEVAFATEIKILAGSVQNNAGSKPQLLRYTEYLKNKYNNRYVLLYLVPDAQKANEEFAKLLESNHQAVNNSCIMFWNKVDNQKQAEDGRVSSNTCQKTFVDILLGILHDYSVGKISPITTEVHYLLRCLINILQNDFNHEEPEITALQRFPDRKQFYENIKEHKDIYDYLETALNGSRQKISRTNTSIGFPFGIARDGQYNILFRVLTMRNYKSNIESINPEDYADRLLIELDREIYQDRISDLEILFKPCASIKAGIHPNGDKGPTPVYVIEFNKQLPTQDLVNDVLREFYSIANKIFADWLENKY